MDVVALLHVLRRRVAAVVLCVLAGIGGALLLTHSTTKLYRAEATVLVSVPASANVQQGSEGVQLTSQLLPTYADIATSRRLALVVKQELQLPESAEALRRKLSAAPETSKLIIDISATDHDPVRARSLADAVSLALSQQVSQLEKERTEGSRIKVDLLDSALTPKTPIDPRPTYNLVVGTLLGVAAGVLLALVLDALDRSIKTGAQTEAATHAPVLGVVPRRQRGSKELAALGNDAIAETYRTLRTGVTFAVPDNPPRVIMVTSASEGEGKTTTAINLAIALAQSGERTAIVDADLRRAGVASALGLEGAVGVTSVITRSSTLESALQVWQDGLIVLPSGQLPPNPSEVVGSQAMGRLLNDLQDYADVIVIDSPPVLPVTDAAVLSTQVEGVIMVVRAGKTQRAQAAEARRRLDGVQAPVIGSVLNGVKRSSAAGYYAAYHPGATARTGA